MQDSFLFELLVAAFRLEIANNFEVNNHSIILELAGGRRVKIWVIS